MPRRRKRDNTQNPSKNAASTSEDILNINKDFAEHYEESTTRKFLRDIPAAVFDDNNESSSSSEEEDEFGELLTKAIDRRVNETLDAIRNRDPRIYDKNTKFFDDARDTNEDSNSISDAEDNSEDEPVAGWNTIANAAEQSTRKLTLKDYVRESLLKNGKLSDDDDGHSDMEHASPGVHDGSNDPADEGSHKLPETFQRSRDGEDKDEKLDSKNARSGFVDSDEDGSDGDDFFTKKEKTAADLEEEARDFDVFMRKRSATTSKQAGEDLLLHSYLEKETPDEKERFLRDFVLNNGWLDKNAAEAPTAHEYEIEIDTKDEDLEARGPHEDDDEFDEKVDNFEAQYNFRFEDPDGAQIVSHARSIPDSMRRPDTRRKRAREARRLRKEQEKAEKTEEIKRLKNLKKKEIQARLLAIQEAAGDGVDLAGIDLEGDFDPDTFNKQMESKFDDEYYSTKDKQMKDIGTEGMAHASERQLPAEEREDIPDDIRDDVKRMADEYYNLDYEDIVGGVPMRFNYKKVEPENFSMTAEDILNADDKELNRLVSLKYLAPYRSKKDVQKQAWKARAALQKRKKARPIHRGEEDGNGNESTDHATPFVAQNSDASGGGSRKRKSRKSKLDTDDVYQQNEEQATMAEDDNDLRSRAHTSAETKNDGNEVQDKESSRKKRKRKRKQEAPKSHSEMEMSENRLKAYGITPAF